MRTKTVCVIVLLGFIGVGPAMADITVSVNPQDQVIDVADTLTAYVDIVADIPESDAITGFGLDLAFDSYLLGTATPTLGAQFNPYSGGTPDGDGLGGLVVFSEIPVWGDDIHLATVQFDLTGYYGVSPLIMSDDNPDDLTEGFAVVPPPFGEFANVVYVAGSIETIPSPTAATLGLLGLFSLGLARRRR